MSGERRNAKRVPYSSFVKFYDADAGDIRDGQGVDMSFSGMCFTSLTPPECDSIVVRLMAGDTPMSVRARVVEVRELPAGMGGHSVHCEFTEWLKAEA